MNKNISFLLIGCSILLAIIVFESFQQYYYITTYNLAGDRVINVWELMWGHSYRWLVWAITALFLFRYLEQTAAQPMDGLKLGLIASMILTLIFIDTILISLLNLHLNHHPITLQKLSESVTFFVFQKGPIFMIAYFCLTLFTRYYYKTKDLVLRIESLESIRKTNTELYQKLKRSNEEDTSIITVKVGKKVRFIPVNDISWISSDNYCVKIFTKDQRKHTLRSSMKKMEGILPADIFIRVHRTAIVNTEEIKEVFFTKNPYLKLKDGTEVDIALSRVPNFRKRVQTIF